MKKFVFTCGDINGVGPEVVIKALNKIYHPHNHKIYFLCPDNVFNSAIKNIDVSFPYSIQKNFSENDKDNIEVVSFTSCKQNIGLPTKQSGLISYKAIQMAAKLALHKNVDAIITAPISKTALKLANVKYPGHTELLADYCNTKNFMMTFLSSNIKCGLITIHEPLSRISKLLNKKRILKAIEITAESLKNDFGISKPRIAVLGLNPHAGENGFIGREELNIIQPAIKHSLYSESCYGPFVPDAFFATKLYLDYDFVIGMYHDQILIPFKLLNFNSGINFTAGLPIIRTSPDHGTAFDIAGKSIANENSTIEAFFWANEIINNRIKNAEKN